MTTKKLEWSFENEANRAKNALKETDSVEHHLRLFREWSSEPDLAPQEIAGLFKLTVSLSRWCEALVLAAAQAPEAWRRVHLVWRYFAFDARVYIDRATQLASEFPELAKRGRLKIGKIEYQMLADLLMTMAFSAVLGEDEAARWLGRRCLKMLREHEPIVTDDALTTGTVQGYLMRLFCLWEQEQVDLAELRVKSYGVFDGVFRNWANADALEEATLALCKIHARKAVNRDKADDDFVFGLQVGPFAEFPVEILFLQRVRKDLGLPVPNPEHPLLRSPLMKIPFPCPRSGLDECLSDAYQKCKAMMPGFHVPWEDEIFAGGQDE